MYLSEMSLDRNATTHKKVYWMLLKILLFLQDAFKPEENFTTKEETMKLPK